MPPSAASGGPSSSRSLELQPQRPQHPFVLLMQDIAGPPRLLEDALLYILLWHQKSAPGSTVVEACNALLACDEESIGAFCFSFGDGITRRTDSSLARW